MGASPEIHKAAAKLLAHLTGLSDDGETVKAVDLEKIAAELGISNAVLKAVYQKFNSCITPTNGIPPSAFVSLSCLKSELNKPNIKN